MKNLLNLSVKIRLMTVCVENFIVLVKVKGLIAAVTERSVKAVIYLLLSKQYSILYSSDRLPPRFYALPKIHI